MKSPFRALRISLFIFAFLFVAQSFAQQMQFADMQSSESLSIADVLDRIYDNKFEAEKTYRVKSLGGIHEHFQLSYGGYPIVQGMVRIHILKNGITRVSYPKVSLENEPKAHPNDAKSALIFGSKIKLEAAENIETSSVYWWSGQVLIPAYKLEIEGPISHKELIIDINNNLLFSNDLTSNSKPDSLIAVNLFLPDPLTSAEVNYGGAYQDFNDSNLAALNAELFIDSIALQWDSNFNHFRLRSPFCRAMDFGEPFVLPPTSDSSNFQFLRGDLGFEYVNTFYHVNQQAEWVVSLGFDSLLQSVDFDAYAQTTDQSSFISSSTNPRIAFGTGGVDDAEDADVIIHEYGHAIAYFAAPGSNSGNQRNAIDEGLGDFFAYCYSKKYSDFESEKLFNWDGQNEFWPGREIPLYRTYPGDLVDNKYSDGLIWTSALKEISDQIGCDATAQLLIESMFSYHENMLLGEAGYRFIQADSLLNNGANADYIYIVLCNKGLYPGCEDTTNTSLPLRNPYLGNTEAFFNENSPLYIYPNKTIASSFSLYSINGQLIVEQEFALASQIYYEIELPDLEAGIYLLKLTTDQGEFGFKIIKAKH